MPNPEAADCEDQESPVESRTEKMQFRGVVSSRRLEFGDSEAFGFFNNDKLQIDVLGPSVTESGNVRRLRLLGAPPKNCA